MGFVDSENTAKKMIENLSVDSIEKDLAQLSLEPRSPEFSSQDKLNLLILRNKRADIEESLTLLESSQHYTSRKLRNSMIIGLKVLLSREKFPHARKYQVSSFIDMLTLPTSKKLDSCERQNLKIDFKT